MLSAVRRVACAPLHAHGATFGVVTTGQGVGAGVRIVVGSSASGMATLTGADGRRKWAFFGPPGVGKGTFASRVSPAVGIPTISTGDIVRAEIKADSELGKQFKHYSDTGALVPDELVTRMVAQRLSQDDCKGGFILDGYPRTTQQAEDLDKMVGIDLVVNFQLKKPVLMQKLTGRRVCDLCGRSYNVADINDGDLVMPPLLPQKGDCDECDGEPPLSQRQDDSEAVIRDRLEVYDKMTHPVVEFYRKRGVLHTFDVKKGMGDLPRLFSELDVEES